MTTSALHYISEKTKSLPAGNLFRNPLRMSAYNPSLFPFDSERGLENVEASPLKIAFWDLDERLLLVNDSLKKMLSWEDKSDPNLSILDLIQPEDHSRYQEAKKQFFDVGHPRTYSLTIDVTLATPNRAKHSITFVLVRSPEGTPSYFRAIIRNADEKKNQLAPETDSLIRQAHVTVSAVDKNGFFIHHQGEVSCNMISSIVGRHFSEVYRGAPEPQNRIRRAMAGEIFNAEVYVEGFWFHIWYEPLLDSHQQVIGTLWTSHPIDKQKHAEMHLEAELRHQKEVVRLREEMLSIASHEIRGPLSTIAMQIDLLQSHMNEGLAVERLQNNFRMLASSGRKQITRVFDFVEKTLDVSRIQERGLSLNIKSCDLAALIREVTAVYAERSAKAGCEIQLNLPERLTGYWDAFRMEQVVENLLSNAVKYGSGKPVRMTLKSELGQVILEVQDLGSGICPEEQKKIFQRFGRASEHKNMAGFGMGLYIVQQIVEAHGGDVHVSSEPGKGATFTVEIPINVLEMPLSTQEHSTI